MLFSLFSCSTCKTWQNKCEWLEKQCDPVSAVDMGSKKEIGVNDKEISNNHGQEKTYVKLVRV